ncbi:MAG: prepilin-type N-terminal cleavage/methylation domain-containing protein [Candidatus Omnitrophota bacterium]
MMLIIGSKNRSQRSEIRGQKKKNLSSVICHPTSGFTLVEVLVAVVVLSVGLVIIYESFLMSLDVINLFFNRLNAQFFISEKIAQVQHGFDQPAGTFFSPNQNGIVTLNNRLFNWQIDMNLLDVRGELYKLDTVVSWKEGSKDSVIRRSTLVKKYFSNSCPEKKR